MKIDSTAAYEVNSTCDRTRHERSEVAHEAEAEAGVVASKAKQSRGVANAVKQTNHAVASLRSNHFVITSEAKQT